MLFSSWLHPIVTILLVFIITSENDALTVSELFKSDSTRPAEKLVALIRVPRSTPPSEDPGKRQARETGKYYPATYKEDPRDPRALKDDEQPIKDPGKRCINCDSRGSTYRGSYDRYYDPLPYYSGSRGRYDPYARNDRDRYIDDYDRDLYRGRNRYSQYESYDPRERYHSGSDRGYTRGLGFDSRAYDYDVGGRERGGYYDPYYRNRYDPYEDDYYTRGGYDSGYSSRGYGGSRPDYYGGSAGYAKGYSYGGDRDRYGGGYGGYGFGGSGYASNGYAGNGYTGSRSRYPTYDYDNNGYRSTSYLYDRPSSTTADPPKNADDGRSDTSSQNGNNRGN